MNTFLVAVRAATVLNCCLLCMAEPGFAQEPQGPFRKILKERFLKKQQDLPAPATDSDINARISKPGDYNFSFEYGGVSRMYRIHVPPSYRVTNPTPLLVSFHGGGASMEYQATDKNYGQISKSDKEGFVLVFPNGYSKFRSGKFATWNAGTCCGPARDEKVDDVGFVKQVIENVSGQLNIDRNRIFATGMSNGGMFAYRLACEMSDTLKAIASVAGPDGTMSCTPKKPVSILHIHARNDDHAQFEGGSGKKSMPGSLVTQFTSVSQTISNWVKRNECNTAPKRVLDKPGAYCDEYAQCKGNVEVELCVTASGGHSWPGAEKSRGDEPPSTAISANDVMWEFFKSR